MKKLKVCWLSAGVSSFIAGYLARDTIDEFIYIDVADQHPDSMRFIKDCKKVLNKKIEVIRSTEYSNVEDCIRRAGIVRMFNGYTPCTALLKKAVRRQWELQTMQQYNFDVEITYVWGMDANEKSRADKLKKTMFEFEHEFPLVDNHLTKQEAHGMCEALGVKRPKMYDLGYNNNNCIGCVRGCMGYWNKIRVDFPNVFESRAKLEREVNSRILKECFLDELPPEKGRMSDEILQECDIFCALNL